MRGLNFMLTCGSHVERSPILTSRSWLAPCRTCARHIDRYLSSEIPPSGMTHKATIIRMDHSALSCCFWAQAESADLIAYPLPLQGGRHGYTAVKTAIRVCGQTRVYVLCCRGAIHRMGTCHCSLIEIRFGTGPQKPLDTFRADARPHRFILTVNVT
jgi:hypothetical protein